MFWTLSVSSAGGPYKFGGIEYIGPKGSLARAQTSEAAAQAVHTVASPEKHARAWPELHLIHAADSLRAGRDGLRHAGEDWRAHRKGGPEGWGRRSEGER